MEVTQSDVGKTYWAILYELNADLVSIFYKVRRVKLKSVVPSWKKGEALYVVTTKDIELSPLSLYPSRKVAVKNAKRVIKRQMLMFEKDKKYLSREQSKLQTKLKNLEKTLKETKNGI